MHFLAQIAGKAPERIVFSTTFFEGLSIRTDPFDHFLCILANREFFYHLARVIDKFCGRSLDTGKHAARFLFNLSIDIIYIAFLDSHVRNSTVCANEP